MDEKQRRSFRRRYLKDYELQTELSDDGREVKVARYVGNFFEPELDGAGLVALRRRCIALSFLAFAAEVTALSIRHGAMASFLAILPLAFCMFPLFYGCAGSLRLPRERRGLRSDEVEYSFDRVRHSAPGIAILGGAAALGALIHHLFFKEGGGLVWGDGLFLLCCGVILTGGALLWRTIRGVKLTERAKKVDWSEGS